MHIGLWDCGTRLLVEIRRSWTLDQSFGGIRWHWVLTIRPFRDLSLNLRSTYRVAIEQVHQNSPPDYHALVDGVPSLCRRHIRKILQFSASELAEMRVFLATASFGKLCHESFLRGSGVMSRWHVLHIKLWRTGQRREGFLVQDVVPFCLSAKKSSRWGRKTSQTKMWGSRIFKLLKFDPRKLDFQISIIAKTFSFEL